MKIAILHHDTEWTETQIEKILDSMGIESRRFDVRKTRADEISGYRGDSHLIVLNRVYASVANRDWNSITRTLALLKELDNRGITAINSYKASLADYSKFFAFLQMKEAGINTPKTMILDENISLSLAVRELGGFPVIVKRDTGGRGKDLNKCSSKDEIMQAAESIRRDRSYHGEIILQEFVEAVEKRDYRVCVLNGEILYHHGRSLISQRKGEEAWLASRSLGSEILPLETSIPDDLAEFALKAAKSVGVHLDVLDIIRTKDGFCVIEHNPTPNFRPEYSKKLGYDPIRRIVDMVLLEKPIRVR